MKTLFYLSFLFFSVLSFGQERTIFGTVTDENNEPLPGATVIVDKTYYTKGTTTDFDGNYSLVATLNDTLVFSYVGMKTQKIRADKDTINVVLKEDERIYNDYLPTPVPRPQRVYTPVVRVTAKDIRNADNPKYNFKKNAKNNVFLIFVSELTDYNFNQDDLEFQGKYHIKYSLTGSYNIEYLKKHNELTFKHLNKKYNKTWQTEIRKDAVGLNDFLK